MGVEDASAVAPASRYSTIAIILHWLIAALLVFEIGLGLRMEAAQGPAKFAAFQLHKSVGITILLLVFLRLVWRLRHKPPESAAGGWERALARFVHLSFYLLLLALPISGWVIVSAGRVAVPTLLYGAIPWPHLPGFAGMTAAAKEGWRTGAEFIHGNFVNLIYLLFALHAAGALKHHFLDRDGSMARMAPGVKAGRWADPRLALIAAALIVAAGLGRQWAPIGASASTSAEAPMVPAPPATAVAAPAPAQATPAASEDGEILAEAEALNEQSAVTNGVEAAKEQLASWTIAPTSTLRFRTKWSGQAIDGAFTRFGGDIDFSPDQLDRSRVEIRIDTASAVTGDGQRDETLKSSDWFSVGSHATAIFKADRFRKTGSDRYVASGTLRLKGVTLPISLPFTLQIRGDEAVMRGNAVVDRIAYKIGEGDFASTSDIPAAVQVEIAVQAKRRP